MGCMSSNAAPECKTKGLPPKSTDLPTYGYWNTRACNRGNLQRYILGYAGVEYNHREYDVTTEEGKKEWKTEKPNLGLDNPNIPYWIDGDFRMTESWAIP